MSACLLVCLCVRVCVCERTRECPSVGQRVCVSLNSLHKCLPGY